MSCAVINNTLSKLFDVVVYHTHISINFKGPKLSHSYNMEKREILQTILRYDLGYCLLEGISAESIRQRNLVDHTSEECAPKKDVAAHILPFFKAIVNNETMTFVQWDTFVSPVDKSIQVYPVCDENDLQRRVLFNYNFIIVYGIEYKQSNLSDAQKKANCRSELQKIEAQHTELKKRKQEVKDELSFLNKRQT